MIASTNKKIYFKIHKKQITLVNNCFMVLICEFHASCHCSTTRNSLFIHGRRAELAQRNNYISSRFHSQYNHIKIIEFLSAWCNSVVLQPLAVELKQFANAIKTVLTSLLKKRLFFSTFTFFKRRLFAS